MFRDMARKFRIIDGKYRAYKVKDKQSLRAIDKCLKKVFNRKGESTRR